MKRSLVAVLAVLAAVVSAFGGTQAAAADGWVVLARNLDNPRGLAFGPHGDIYVAEAGRGGPGPCAIAGGGELVCVGPTGAVTRITAEGQERVLTGLPSIAGPLGFAATGAHDVSFQGGQGFIAVGLGGRLAQRTLLGPGGAALAHLVRFVPGGAFWEALTDFAPFEEIFNPDGGDINPNPYAVLARPGHRYVVDAGANDLLDARPGEWVGRRSGGISLVTVFPRRLVPAPPFLPLPPGALIPMESVPDSLVRGPDGALYVGELTGFPFPVDGAWVHRVDPTSLGPPTVYRTGFTAIIDIAFGEDGSLYVLEYQTNGFLSPDPTGALIRVAPNGTRTTIASAGLVNPGGLLVRGDFAYVSNFSISPGGGQVVRIPLD